MLKLPFPSAPDEILVRGVLEDRPREFELLVLRHRRNAYALAGAIGVPPLSLEEIVQDSFLQAFEHLPHLRHHENFGLWFLNIVRNTARRFMREKMSMQVRWIPTRERWDEDERFEQEEFNELL
jgi:DNA-directed RNA polymerase specialized sigma24 family protein